MMERLTYRRDLDGYSDVGLVEGVTIGDVICQLAAYEDTGLEPKTLNEFAPFLLEMKMNMGAMRHLKELLQAEKDGRLVVLPCKPGQTVWVESCIKGKSTSIEAPDIEWIIENTERFGAEIFLTYEEAEEALKKRGRQGHEKSDSNRF